MTVALPAVRSGLAFRRDPLAFLLSLDGASEVVRFRAGLTDFTLIRNPETIHRVLVTDADAFGEGKWTLRGERVMRDCLITRDGAPHRDRRALLQPSFERRRLTARAGAIVERADRLADSWQDGEVVEIRGEMSRLALAAAGDALFSLDLEPEAPALVPALMTMLHEIPRPGVPWPGGRRLAAARRLLHETTTRLIAHRPQPAGKGDDLLSALLAGRGNGGGGMSDVAVRDEVVSLLIAAVDTTPGTLAWLWLLLSRHPDAEAALNEELQAVLAERPPTVDDLPKLAYLEKVLNEVLRLYPPVHFIDRRALVDVELDGCPVGAGSFLLLSPLLTHRDPRFYPEPTAFRPERWGRGQQAARPRYAYFPFGGGPHTCIGMVLARMELSLIVATLASRWRLRPGPGLPAEPSPQTSSFPMTLVAR